MEKKVPSFTQAIFPIILLVIVLALNIKVFRDDAVSGPNQLALLFASAVSGIIAIKLGRTWKDIRAQIVKNIGDAMPSILILLMIGALAGTWMISGVVPALVYYGLKMLNTETFLFVAVIVSAIVSLSTGSSWSTIATIGVALFGIGVALGFDKGMIAGAIISGAYFGDKMSPLSDTTNLAPAMAGTDLFTHVKYMIYTTAPTLLITLVIFLILGFTGSHNNSQINTSQMLEALKQNFNITPWLLIVPVLLTVVIIKKTPPLPSLFFGILLGALFAVIFQQDLLVKMNTDNINKYEFFYKIIMKSMYGKVSVHTQNEQINNLLTTQGMSGMLSTIWLILSAMVFSGVMESAGMLKRIADAIVNYAKSTGSLVASTVATSIFMNITASDQYISIVVPGRMYADIYRKKGLKPEVLSRTLEDGGTVTSVLVPWNTGGAVQSTVLGVPTLTYLPYAFFNLISPLMSIFFAYANIKIRRYSEKSGFKIQTQEEKL